MLDAHALPALPFSFPSPPLQRAMCVCSIINEPDPVLRQRKRTELAQGLQAEWIEQVRHSLPVAGIRCDCKGLAFKMKAPLMPMMHAFLAVRTKHTC